LFKATQPRAELVYMPLRPLLRRRRRAAATLAVAVAAVLSVLPSSPAAATGTHHAGASYGELGSGPAGPAVPSPTAADASSWDDVAAGHWALAAINHVARTHDWMRDFGESTFQPGAKESRKLFARAMVLAFAPDATVSPTITFTDLAPEDPFFPFANIAVKKRWMAKVNGAFRPDAAIRTVAVHRALVWALGLKDEALGLDAIATSDGAPIMHRANLGALDLGMLLYLRKNHGTESMDVGPTTRLSRAEVAWSLYRADRVRTSETWRLADLAPFATIRLGALDETMRQVVEFGLDYVGYPYVYGGEWHTKSPAGYCCGSQPVGGFDCSGLVWWLVKASANGYNAAAFRSYPGWSLPERSSSDMATAVIKKDRLTYEEALPGDLLFYDGNDDGTVDHVDLYLGDGWVLDSSTGVGGVTIQQVGDGWYRDHFTWARRIVT
jgi:cell wall-associated NlpC family hydrolase